MEINAAAVKEYRLQRGWTQQHLADACDLSLRTIQRAERFGNSSQETVQAMASVFETELSDFKLVPEPESLTELDEGIKLPFALLALGLLIGFIAGLGASLFIL